MQWTGRPRSFVPCVFASINANRRVIQSRFFSVTIKKSRSSSGFVPWYAVEPVIATRRTQGAIVARRELKQRAQVNRWYHQPAQHALFRQNCYPPPKPKEPLSTNTYST